MCLNQDPILAASMQQAVSKASPFVKLQGEQPCITYLEDNGAKKVVKSLVWNDFTTKVETLAGYIQSLPQGRITILLKRSASMQVAQAACHLAGRTFVPIDPTWPIHRVHKLIHATESVAMIVDEGSPFPADENLPNFAIVMNMKGSMISPTPSGTYKAVDAPEVMYIMFTSGSTGEPKGVEVYSDSVWNHLLWKADIMKIAPTDVFLIKTPFTFDVSIGELWLPLVTGAVSHVLGDGLHLEADRVYEALALGEVTICHFVPSVLTLFLSQLDSQLLKNPLKKLRMVHCTGEALKQEHRVELSKVISPKVQLLNLYGPTEAAIEVTYMYCEEKEEQYLSHGFPIGFVPKGVEIFITDVNDSNRLVADGEKGEICIAGIQVAKGYLNLPEKTAERFMPCPWSSEGRGMMYKTGDLGRRNPETGWLEYNGRFDRQVKIGGVRIELGEIESVVMNAFGETLDAAAVILDKNQSQLLGVLVPKDGCDDKVPSMSQISDAVLEELPHAYNPHEWHTMSKDELPLSTAGKIDFNALEKRLLNDQSVQIWAEVYDQLYDDNQCTTEAGADPTMDWASYKDSFDPSRLHRRDVITEWVNETVEMTLSLARESAGSEQAASVCEMGCGKGMIVLKTAPRVKAAVCGDVSKFALQHVEKVWNGYMKENNMQGHNKAMHIVNCDAAAFEKLPKSIPEYNVVLQNGVSMYLPSFTYLLSYFDGAFDHIHERDGGAVILGDVRSFHHSPLFQLRRLMQVGSTAEEARANAADVARDDKDRTYDYRAFHALHHLGHLPDKVVAVELQLKRGALASEFTGYRYDVIYHVRGSAEKQEEKKNSRGEDNDAYGVSIVADYSESKSFNLDKIVDSLQAAIATSTQADETVFGVLNIPNERLWSDHMVASRQSDDIAFATDGVGVKPSDIRNALNKAFPSKHVYLTWSRQISGETKLSDSCLAAMDVFILPSDDYNSKMSGLRGVSKFILEPHITFCSKLRTRSDYESCISAIQAQKSANNTNNQDFVSASKFAKELLEKGDTAGAVETLVACSLGHTRGALKDMVNSASANVTFEELGGNSFMGMKLILQLRAALGAAPAVFKILTEPLTAFLDDAVSIVERQRESSNGDWMVEGEIAGTAGVVSNDAPVIVLFPTAGGSPKVYAKAYSHLKNLVAAQLTTGARVMLAQPPGRDARASEPNCTNFDDLVSNYSQALVEPLKLSTDSSNSNKVIMCGDSLGSVTCWAVAHNLRSMFPDFKPAHMVLSGNPAPETASKQYGLGTFASKSIHDETDEDLLAFLEKGHAGFGSDGDVQEILDALRSDCIMYEDFKRAPDAQPLPLSATLCRGAVDPFVTPEDMDGWKTEFLEGSENVVIEGAGHHIYSDAGQEMAQLLVNLAKQKCA